MVDFRNITFFTLHAISKNHTDVLKKKTMFDDGSYHLLMQSHSQLQFLKNIFSNLVNIAKSMIIKLSS